MSNFVRTDDVTCALCTPKPGECGNLKATRVESIGNANYVIWDVTTDKFVTKKSKKINPKGFSSDVAQVPGIFHGNGEARLLKLIEIIR